MIGKVQVLVLASIQHQCCNHALRRRRTRSFTASRSAAPSGITQSRMAASLSTAPHDRPIATRRVALATQSALQPRSLLPGPPKSTRVRRAAAINSSREGNSIRARIDTVCMVYATRCRQSCHQRSQSCQAGPTFEEQRTRAARALGSQPPEAMCTTT